MTPSVPTAASAAGASTVDALVVENLSKRFGGALALNGVDLSIRQREVHGLLGSNGSGKSTLIKILAGFHAPEPGGRIRLFGRDVPLPVPGSRANSLGLAFVHQNLGLIPSLSLTENLRLVRLASTPAWRISWRREREAAADVFSRYGLRLDPRATAGSLSAGRAGPVRHRPGRRGSAASSEVHGGGLLVLDEPTPFLPRVGVDQLFALVRKVVAEGASVIFVSHDVAEVMEITDRATVLRDGIVVGTLETRSASHDAFVERIIGRSVVPFHVHARAPDRRRPAIRARQARRRGPRAGFPGDRRRRDRRHDRSDRLGFRPCLRRASMAPSPPPAGGSFSRRGRRSISPMPIRRRRSMAGIAYLPADRLGAAGIGGLSVADNMMFPMLDRMRNGFGLDRRRMIRTARGLGAAFAVKPNIPLLPLSELSGGNQQKALMAKWLQTKPRLILLDEPTQGVDVGARQQLLAAIDAASREGASILLASTDYEQLAQICHRVVVFARGQVTAELTGAELTNDTIAEYCYHSMTSIA